MGYSTLFAGSVVNMYDEAYQGITDGTEVDPTVSQYWIIQNRPVDGCPLVRVLGFYLLPVCLL